MVGSLNNQTPSYVKERFLITLFTTLGRQSRKVLYMTNQTQSSKVIYLAILEWKHGINYPNV